MSESLRNDGRVWTASVKGETRAPGDIPEAERDYFLERRYPSFGNLVPRDVASRAAKKVVEDGFGVGAIHNGVYLDFADAINRLGRATIEQRYGNLFEMYAKITGDDPYKAPMRIYPAVHYTMGGLWVDYNLMSNLPGLFVAGEANFSDHGANRLGASALMQGLADGYFVLPTTIAGELANQLGSAPVSTSDPAFREAEEGVRERVSRLLGIKGEHSADYYHRKFGRILWDYCGMARTAEGLTKAIGEIGELREDFYKNLKIVGDGASFNWPGGRLLRTRRADVSGRAQPGGIVRRPLPRRAPDARGRGTPRRRELRARLRMGVRRGRQAGNVAQRAT